MSRKKILKAIAENKPKSCEFPKIPQGITYPNKVKVFQENLLLAGGESQIINNLSDIKLNKKNIINSNINTIPSYNTHSIIDNHSCKILDYCLVQSSLAISENGSIWLEDQNYQYRSALFLAKNLIVVIKKSCIVSNMHEAYSKISIKGKRFGIFISGPSKTADIEQSLVIGAHGSRYLKVYIIKGQ